MNLIISITTFITIFLIIVEIILSLGKYFTMRNIRKIIQNSKHQMEKINYSRSTGEPHNVPNLNFMLKGTYEWVPAIFRNDISEQLRDKTTTFILEGGDFIKGSLQHYCKQHHKKRNVVFKL